MLVKLISYTKNRAVLDVDGKKFEIGNSDTNATCLQCDFTLGQEQFGQEEHIGHLFVQYVHAPKWGYVNEINFSLETLNSEDLVPVKPTIEALKNGVRFNTLTNAEGKLFLEMK
jgi:hypothetical protein